MSLTERDLRVLEFVEKWYKEHDNTGPDWGDASGNLQSDADIENLESLTARGYLVVIGDKRYEPSQCYRDLKVVRGRLQKFEPKEEWY
jgi:hypothetical protein